MTKQKGPAGHKHSLLGRKTHLQCTSQSRVTPWAAPGQCSAWEGKPHTSMPRWCQFPCQPWPCWQLPYRALRQCQGTWEPQETRGEQSTPSQTCTFCWPFQHSKSWRSFFQGISLLWSPVEENNDLQMKKILTQSVTTQPVVLGWHEAWGWSLASQCHYKQTFCTGLEMIHSSSQVWQRGVLCTQRVLKP